MQFDAVLVRDDTVAAAPTVLVFHGMEGRSDAQLQFASRLTEWGYQAIAVDLFGEEVSGGGLGSTTAAMAGYLEDRAALGQRLTTVLDALMAAPEVDAGRVAAIGFCFGGLCVLDLARGGHPLAGVCEFPRPTDPTSRQHPAQCHRQGDGVPRVGRPLRAS
ncbi:Uncharacterised protein [Mycolicibacterium vanbaalenii]|uniref:Dienelactone hydrolase domain-containing protein n=1 Tax=Mycolicibacterium vanbaalenii TaxID=110539 RepID=A0A5S9RAP3_MYCVN|nr:Uncharacterised protein [Mycolicibacterium vanbaalenii]